MLGYVYQHAAGDSLCSGSYFCTRHLKYSVLTNGKEGRKRGHGSGERASVQPRSPNKPYLIYLSTILNMKRVRRTIFLKQNTLEQSLLEGQVCTTGRHCKVPKQTRKAELDSFPHFARRGINLPYFSRGAGGGQAGFCRRCAMHPPTSCKQTCCLLLGERGGGGGLFVLITFSVDLPTTGSASEERDLDCQTSFTGKHLHLPLSSGWGKSCAGGLFLLQNTTALGVVLRKILFSPTTWEQGKEEGGELPPKIWESGEAQDPTRNPTRKRQLPTWSRLQPSLQLPHTNAPCLSEVFPPPPAPDCWGSSGSRCRLQPRDGLKHPEKCYLLPRNLFDFPRKLFFLSLFGAHLSEASEPRLTPGRWAGPACGAGPARPPLLSASAARDFAALREETAPREGSQRHPASAWQARHTCSLLPFPLALLEAASLALPEVRLPLNPEPTGRNCTTPPN